MGKKRNQRKQKIKEKLSDKPKIDPQLLKDLNLKDVFRFPNDDVYLGELTFTLEGGIFRQGRGKYFASDGSFLIGQWDHDVLVEAERLSCPDGGWYKGVLVGGRYSGPGVFHHPGVGTLECNFHQGRPEGRVAMTDRDGYKWEGQANAGSATMLPRNHFFDSEEALLHRRKEYDKTLLSNSSLRKTIDSKTSKGNSRILCSVEKESSQS